MTKKNNQRNHAEIRLLERYGMAYTKPMREKILRTIQEKKSKVIERRSSRVSVHTLTYDDVPLKLVYDSVRKEIVTFLNVE